MPIQSLIDLFAHAIERHPKPDALMVKQHGRYQPISTLQFRQQVEEVATGLMGMGIKRGDRVALLSENRPEWATADMGMLAIGAVTVPIYSTLPASQMEYLLGNAGVSLIIVSNSAQLTKIRQIRSQLPMLKQIVILDPGGMTPDASVTEFRQLLEVGRATLAERPGCFEEVSRQVGPHDVASIIYTSGTTGTPKGVRLSHWNIVSNVLACCEVFDIGPRDVTLSFLPLCHIFERTVDYLMIYCGATIAYAETPETVPQNMLEIRPTIVPSVPRLFEKMHARIMDAIGESSRLKRHLMQWALQVGRAHLRQIQQQVQPSAALAFQLQLASWLVFSKLRRKLGGRLRFFVSGGAPLDKELAEFFLSVGVLILEGYGLTETSPVIAVNRLTDYRLGSAGKPISSVEVKIAEDGEILARGPSVMLGYHDLERETSEAMADGWFHTGDIGRLDGDGFLYVTERKKDLIVTASGKNVAPQKIEGALKMCGYLQNVVVIGDKRPYISALVVPQASKIIAYALEKSIPFEGYPDLICNPEINRFLMGQIRLHMHDLAQFEQIKRIALLEHDFSLEAGELTPSLKPRRRFIEAKHRDVIEGLYNHASQPA